MTSADLTKKKRPTETAERQAGDAISGGECQDAQTAASAQASSASVLPIAISKPGWRVRALKHVANVQFSNVDKHTVEDEVPVQLCNYTDVYKNDLIVPDMDFMQASATPAEIKKFRLRENDVIITKDSETWEDIAIPAHVTASMDGVLCGYHLAQLRPRPDALRGKFLFYCLKARPVAYHFNISAFGITRFGLSNADIGRAPIPVPPLDTQDDIVTYLNRETRRIDTIIEKNRRLLELIDEKRGAFVYQQLCAGDNLEPTGIDWLPKAPRHWKRIKIKRAARMQSGDAITAIDIQDGGDYPVYGGNGIRGYYDKFNRDGEFVLIGRQGAHCGNVHRVSGKFWASEHAVVARPERAVDPDWLAFTLRAMSLGRFSLSAAQPGLAVDRVAEQYIALPPYDEQLGIAKNIATRLDALRLIEAKVTRAIDLLRERRLALISAAVTGKLEVPRS